MNMIFLQTCHLMDFAKEMIIFCHCVKMMASFPPPLEQTVIFFSLSTWNHGFCVHSPK